MIESIDSGAGRGVTGGANDGSTQDTIGGASPDIGDDIQQAFRGLGALPFHEDFAEGSFGTF